MSDSNIHYGELEKYFVLLRNGNVIASRLYNGQTDYRIAKVLFGDLIEDFVKTYVKEKENKNT